jgi:hypothetical protein
MSFDIDEDITIVIAILIEVRIKTNIPAYHTAAINSDCHNKLKIYIYLQNSQQK